MFRILNNTQIDFQSKRRVAFVISGLLILVGLVSLIVRGGPNYSIDFEGGMQAVIRFDEAVTTTQLRTELDEIGYSDAEIKTIGGSGHNDLMLRIEQTPEGEKAIHDIQAKLNESFGGNNMTILSIEAVGPQIGHELRRAALLAIVASLFFIVIYLSWRFQYRYGIAAIVALAHDVLIVFGLFSLLNLQISLAVIAAFLTIVGYSLNDTIVVFDRIRENVKKLRSKSLFDQINISINETLSRTILTSGTTLIVVFILYFFGGMVIHDFAFALLAGVVVGTYSSIFVASPILVEWNNRFPEKRKKR
ncbi:protein translocase subunit SecF [bacterium]|nr:protein translocase subunit SecF [bacterium]